MSGGAQLVAHIGQEIRLVLARLFELSGFQLQGSARAFQFVALRLQRLRLFLQLAVRLLEFDLLQFEARLRFLERGALFLQFLV